MTEEPRSGPAGGSRRKRGSDSLPGPVFSERSVTPVCFTIHSALAEGADGLVVREAFAVLGQDVRVEAILPRDADDYIEDFTSAASRHEFEDLLSRASTQSMPAAMSATEGYERGPVAT